MHNFGKSESYQKLDKSLKSSPRKRHQKHGFNVSFWSEIRRQKRNVVGTLDFGRSTDARNTTLSSKLRRRKQNVATLLQTLSDVAIKDNQKPTLLQRRVRAVKNF